MVSKAVVEAFGPPGQHDGTPLGKAIQRKLGLDTPMGKTTFYTQFRSSHPADLTQRSEQLLPSVRQELVYKLVGQ